MRKRGFEPRRYCYRQPLKLVRLPVPPLPQSGANRSSIWQKPDADNGRPEGLRYFNTPYFRARASHSDRSISFADTSRGRRHLAASSNAPPAQANLKVCTLLIYVTRDVADAVRPSVNVTVTESCSSSLPV